MHVVGVRIVGSGLSSRRDGFGQPVAINVIAVVLRADERRTVLLLLLRHLVCQSQIFEGRGFGVAAARSMRFVLDRHAIERIVRVVGAVCLCRRSCRVVRSVTRETEQRIVDIGSPEAAGRCSIERQRASRPASARCRCAPEIAVVVIPVELIRRRCAANQGRQLLELVACVLIVFRRCRARLHDFFLGNVAGII